MRTALASNLRASSCLAPMKPDYAQSELSGVTPFSGKAIATHTEHTAHVSLDIQEVMGPSHHPPSSDNVEGHFKKYICLVVCFGCLNSQFSPSLEEGPYVE